MNRNRILKHFHAGEKALGLIMKSGDPELVELAARIGLDYFMIDGQHAAITVPQVENLCRIATGFGITPAMRVPDQRQSTLLTYLDRGMRMLIVPDLQTRDQAEAMVRHCFYAPKGLRSATSFNVVMDSAEATREDTYANVNRETLIVPQLESATAFANLDSILQVDGLDFFTGGPEDVAQSMGYPGQPKHPDVVAAIEDAEARVRAAGKHMLGDWTDSVEVISLVAESCTELLKRNGREPAFTR